MIDGPPLTAEALRRALADSPFQQIFDLGLRSFDAAAGIVELEMRFTPAVERQQGTGQYHGGALASLIDIAGDFALLAMLGHGVPTINLRVDYLRPATAGTVIARAAVRKAGRMIGVVDIEVTDAAGRLVAIGRANYGTQAG